MTSKDVHKPLDSAPTDDSQHITRRFLPSLAGALSGFRSLRVRNYRLYFISQVISLTGTWMQTTAQAWLVLKLTGSPLVLGLVTTLQYIPVTLLVLFGGVIADRLPKRRMIIFTQTLALLQAAIFGLLVLFGHIQLWHVYVLAVILGIITDLDNPVRQAFVVEMVGRDDLVNAVALNSMVFNGARIIGPSIAGIVIALIGIAPTLLLNAASFVPVIIAMLMIDPGALHNTAKPSSGSALARLKEGVNYTFRTPSIFLVIIVIAAIGTFGYNFTVVLPLLADKVLFTDSVGFGTLWSFLGVGSLVAAIFTAYTRSISARRLIITAGIFSVLFAVLALSTVYALTALLLTFIGFFGILSSTAANSLLQLHTPDELRGRVLSFQTLLFVGSTPIGGFLVGVLSQYLSVQMALFVCGVLCLSGVLVANGFRRSHRGTVTI